MPNNIEGELDGHARREEAEGETHDSDRLDVVPEELEEVLGHGWDVGDEGGVGVGQELGEVGGDRFQADGEELDHLDLACRVLLLGGLEPGLVLGGHVGVPSLDVHCPLRRALSELLLTTRPILVSFRSLAIKYELGCN